MAYPTASTLSTHNSRSFNHLIQSSQVLNPESKARDQTSVFIDISCVHYCSGTRAACFDLLHFCKVWMLTIWRYDFLEKKIEDALYRCKSSMDDCFATTQMDFQMGKMTPRKARALSEHRCWTIDTSNSGLPIDPYSPKMQGSGEVSEPEKEEAGNRAF